MRLKNKVAIVTGGSRDIGRAVSIQLAAEGAKVVINYLSNLSNAEETLNLIKENGGEAIIVKGDVTKSAEVTQLIDQARAAFGEEIHILVNVAGGMVARSALALKLDVWSTVRVLWAMVCLAHVLFSGR
jgi:3-oxoacyl-[acyl-carrier protein] reductase